MLTRTLISFFISSDPPPTEIYTLSLHDALPISGLPRGDGQLARRRLVPRRARLVRRAGQRPGREAPPLRQAHPLARDRKSTRLNSSHVEISYAVFCLKKKTKRKA